MSHPDRPQVGEYAEYFETYVSLVDEANVMDAFAAQSIELQEFFSAVESSELQVLHGQSTWTLKQVLGHCIDTERVLGYRAGYIAVSHDADLPGFDQDEFVANVDYNSVPVDELLKEFVSCRRSHELMFSRFSATNWGQSGKVDQRSISVRALAYVMVGHVRHHLNIIRGRVGLV